MFLFDIASMHTVMESSTLIFSESGQLKHEIVGLITAALALSLYALYQHLLPKPLPEIPYNIEAAQSLLGDLPAIQKESPNSPIGWMIKQARRQASPLCQFFISPFGKPCVLVADFREGQNILMRRKEFERSDYSIAVLGGDMPSFHINLKTGPEWKEHRRLLQDLMTPKFLHNVAAPNIYKSAMRLVEMWKIKAEVAAIIPFSAEQDIFYAALDAVYDFGFGDSLVDRALVPQVERLRTMSRQDIKRIQDRSLETGVANFPVQPIHPSIEATLKIAENIAGVAGSGFPTLAWWLKSLQPSVRKTRAIIEEFTRGQAMEAVKRLQSQDPSESEAHFRSAIDLMMQRERTFAIKGGRDPVYWSKSIRDKRSPEPFLRGKH